MIIAKFRLKIDNFDNDVLNIVILFYDLRHGLGLAFIKIETVNQKT